MTPRTQIKAEGRSVAEIAIILCSLLVSGQPLAGVELLLPAFLISKAAKLLSAKKPPYSSEGSNKFLKTSSR